VAYSVFEGGDEVAGKLVGVLIGVNAIGAAVVVGKVDG